MDANSSSSSLHIAMFPWFALGHITPFLQISNKLAERGHRISFLVPTKTVSKIQRLNRFPSLIDFVPIAVPSVHGLPLGAETTADVPSAELFPHIMTAMDRTEPEVEALLRGLGPDVVFFDFTHWIPKLARQLGFKTVYLAVVSPVFISYVTGYASAAAPPEERLLEPPPGYPDPSIRLRRHELRYFIKTESQTFGSGIKLVDRLRISAAECDVYASKGCREIDGPFIDFLEKRVGLEVSLVGPILPEPAAERGPGLDPEWDRFLSGFEHGSVVYCGFGSEQRLSRGQFQELILGLELSGRPFLAALKPPVGAQTVEEALPDGFLGRVGARGAVFGGWIQQPLVLGHPAVGCYVTHGGYGSVLEGIAGGCQLVMVPYESDQIFNARLIASRLGAGVEVERSEDDGSFTRQGVCSAIRAVSGDEDGDGREIREKYAELRELLLGKGLDSSYVDEFCRKLQALAANLATP